MKKIILLTMVCMVWLNAQNAFTDYMVKYSALAVNDGIKLSNRTYALGTTVDTTYAQDIRRYSSFVVGLQTTDTASITIAYQLSVDGTNWTAATSIDSLRQATATPVTKAYTATTVALGMSYIRFIFTFNKSNLVSIDYPSAVRKYWATLKKVQ